MRSLWKVLPVRTQPRKGTQMKNETEKTYLVPKTSLEALKMSTMEMSDTPKTRCHTPNTFGTVNMEPGTYYQFKFILEQAMSATHVAVILRMRTGPAYEEESMKTDYPNVRNEYGMS